MSTATTTTEEAVQDFISACLDRCLTKTASWVSDLLLSARSDVLQEPVAPTYISPSSVDGELKTRCQLAKALIQNQEYQRANFVLNGNHNATMTVAQQPKSATKNSQHPLPIFLGCYAIYLDGEKSRLSSCSGANINKKAIHPHLHQLRETLQYAVEKFPRDTFLLWLTGVVYRECLMRKEAAVYFSSAAALHPLMWCAWQDLSKLISKETQLTEVLQSHASMHPIDSASPSGGDFFCMRRLFSGLVLQEIQQFHDAKLLWEQMLKLFPSSSFIKSQIGSCWYHKKEYDAAQTMFSDVHQQDPFRLDNMDEYSNVLFMKDDRTALSSLAQHCFSVDPYRAESNCVAGNYYSRMLDRAKSLMHFKRAVVFDAACLSAWTLMGHEYVEVRNIHAAAEAYRAALAVDQRDYRAWYGLGQVYELLQMYHYALHYYWFTTMVRPKDARMWYAVAGCLEKQYRQSEAITCYERAEAMEPTTGDVYPSIVRKLTDHYVHGNPRKAITYYEKLVAASYRTNEDLISALPFLIQHYYEQAQDLLEVPARSQSCQDDPIDASTAGRPSIEVRKRSGLALIEKCEMLLEMLMKVIQEQLTSGGSVAAPGELRERMMALDNKVKKMQQDVEKCKRFL